MDDIKVSVIVPVYNGAEYIRTSISSIINQEFSENYEIIVIDDGSTDDSLDIAYELLSKADIPYKLVHQRNSGVSIARNHGIEVARGDYVVFVDSDDYILTNHLSELYNPKTDFSLTQMAKNDSKSTIKSINYPEIPLSTKDLIKMELQIVYYLTSLFWQSIFLHKWHNSELNWCEGCRKLKDDTCFAIFKLFFLVRMTHYRKEHTVYTDTCFDVVRSITFIRLRIKVFD